MSNTPGCNFTGAMRDGEIALDTILATANNDQTEFRFDTAVKGVGCYLQLFDQAVYTARMRAYDAGGAQLGSSTIKNGTSTNAYSTGIFEAAIWLGLADDAADVADIARVDVNVKSGTLALTDAAFDAGTEAHYYVGSLVFGPFDPLAAVVVTVEEDFTVEAGGGGIELAITQTQRALAAQSLHPAQECLNKMGTRLHDAGALWSERELLDWYNDGYRELLALSGAIRRHRPIPLPPRRALTSTQEWEDRHADGPVGKATHALAAGAYQALAQWEVEQSVA